ncbi:ParB/RepB/Spo0J family partition protein [Rubrobacter aplysinae]|uniref:ParB/RepB/Spo0J family partition protein n=1 Tax=Rubrobacter aplysinae TaxID=909625 RepID=UPI00064C06BB|nr:ParB/RepB/Spo0J family partition protein [Rubrobacter aplysinae]
MGSRRGLGRGLSALIATGESVGGLRFEEIPTSAVRSNVHQPRRSFPETGIQELAASIREVGILQPLVVRATEEGFELIAGERRLRAAKEAGLDRVPVLIRQAHEGESMELALVENLQREDLNPLETAAAYQALMESFGLSREQLASRLGKSRAAVTNTIRLMQLPEAVRSMVAEGRLSEGHARALLTLQDEEQMLKMAAKVESQRLSVRKLEQLVREDSTDQASSQSEEQRREPQRDKGLEAASKAIQEATSLPTKVRKTRRGGKIEIAFREQEDLEALINLLTSSE